MANPYMQGEESITQAEHISPVKTGDNIAAKKVALYGWDGSAWQRGSMGLQAGTSYDYLDVQQTNATTETYVYKVGGSGGTTVRTVVVVYTDSTKVDLDTITWS